MEKTLESQPVHKEKYLKTKVKSYNGKIKTDFHDKKYP